ncbi:MAG: hypothetical protein ACLQM6_14760 [Acidobacteriaceae bacterium]
MKVADELFLVLALLHREHPDKDAFEIGEVLARAAKEGLGENRTDQKSLRIHAYQHAAANMPPGHGGKYRMVFRERDNRIRLLAPTDYIHPDRHQKFYPSYEEIPEQYHELLDWAKRRCADRQEGAQTEWLAGLRKLTGLGKEIWAGIDPDAYVRSLREGWE